MMQPTDNSFTYSLSVRTQRHKPHTWFKFFNEVNGRKLYLVQRKFSGFYIYNQYHQLVAKLNYNWTQTKYKLFQKGRLVATIKYLYPIAEYHDIFLFLKQQCIVLSNIKQKNIQFYKNDYIYSSKNFQMRPLQEIPTLEFGKLGVGHYRLSFNKNIPFLVAVSLILTRF